MRIYLYEDIMIDAVENVMFTLRILVSLLMKMCIKAQV